MNKIKKTKTMDKLSEKIRSHYFEPQTTNGYIQTASTTAYQNAAETSFETDDAPVMSMSERSQFIHKKMNENETSKQQSIQHESLKQGVISALSNQLFAISRLKKQLQDLKQQFKSKDKIILKLCADMKQVKLENEQLKKEVKHYKKENKELQKDVKYIKKIILLQSSYANVCNKNTPFDELVSEWKYANKHAPKKQM